MTVVVKTYQLAEPEAQAAIAALHEYRFETQNYMRNNAAATHEECCKVGQMHARMAREREEALGQRLKEIDGALQALGGWDD